MLCKSKSGASGLQGFRWTYGRVGSELRHAHAKMVGSSLYMMPVKLLTRVATCSATVAVITSAVRLLNLQSLHATAPVARLGCVKDGQAVQIVFEHRSVRCHLLQVLLVQRECLRMP